MVFNRKEKIEQWERRNKINFIPLCGRFFSTKYYFFWQRETKFFLLLEEKNRKFLVEKVYALCCPVHEVVSLLLLIPINENRKWLAKQTNVNNNVVCYFTSILQLSVELVWKNLWPYSCLYFKLVILLGDLWYICITTT